MSDRRVGLLRHGITRRSGCFCGSSDPELSAAGWAKMEEAITGYRWDLMVSSPLRRCREFAVAASRGRHVPLLLDARLVEMAFGDWEGLEPSRIWERDPGALSRFWEDPSRHPPPRGEPFSQFLDRVRSAWQSIISRGEQRILVVSHGGPIRLIRACVERRRPERLLEIDIPCGSLHWIERRVGTMARDNVTADRGHAP